MCENGFTGTYNGPMFGGENTYGGYSSSIVVNEKFVLNVSHTDGLAAVAPLLCAGITTYSPLRHWNIGKGHKVGIVGLGGLGHMGVKIAAAMGAHVVLFTTSPDKKADALRLGASEVVISKNAKRNGGARQQFRLHPRYRGGVAQPRRFPLIAQARRHHDPGGRCPENPHPSPAVFNLILKRRRLAGSLIGGIAETQEMLDFCAQHGIVSDIEMIRMDQINEAYERMLKSDVKYRFVIDMATLG